MKLSKKPNTVAVLLVVLLLIILFSVTAFYLARGGQHELGVPPQLLTIKEIYRSEPWAFYLSGFTLSFPEGSCIAPVYFGECLAGIVVLGEGKTLAGQTLPRFLTLDDFFLSLNYETYSRLKGDTLFLPLKNPLEQQHIEDIARHQLPVVQGIIYPLVCLPSPSATLIYSDNSQSLPPAISGRCCSWRLFTFYGLVILVTLLIVYLSTMGLQPSPVLRRLYAAKPQLGEKFVAVFLLGVLLVMKIPEMPPALTVGTIPSQGIVFYFTALFLLLIVYRKELPGTPCCGLPASMRSCLTGIGMVPIILTVVILFTTGKFPIGVEAIINTKEAIRQFILLLGYMFAREFFWRGYMQTFLERLWGKAVGLITATALFTLPVYLSAYRIYGPLLPPGRALEVLFFFPLTALVPAYLYQRSRNLLGVALLQALLLFLPGLLIF